MKISLTAMTTLRTPLRVAVGQRGVCGRGADLTRVRCASTLSGVEGFDRTEDADKDQFVLPTDPAFRRRMHGDARMSVLEAPKVFRV